MAETINGGAYLVVGLDGSERWLDAEGKPLNKADAGEAQRQADQRQADRDDQERARISLEAQRNPTAQAIAAAMAPKAPAAAPRASEK